MSLVEDAQRAAALLRGHAYVRILAASTGDALCATALLAHALRREGIDYHASWVAEPTSEHADATDALVLVGLDSPVHVPLVSIDADDASLGAQAQMVAVALAARNADLAPLALAGALAARKHLDGRGPLDASVLRQATESGIVTPQARLALRGPSLLAALSQMDEPALAGVTGRARNAKKLLTDLQLPDGSPPSALRPEESERLGSALALRLLESGAPGAAIEALFRPRLTAARGPHAGLDAGELALLAEAAAARGRCGLGFAAMWPDENAINELSDLALALRDELVAPLVTARQDGPLRVADAPTAELCAPLADRLALAGGVAVARHASGSIAVRAYGRDIGALVAAAASACGGSARRGRVVVPLAEEGRFSKLLAEAVA